MYIQQLILVGVLYIWPSFNLLYLQSQYEYAIRSIGFFYLMLPAETNDYHSKYYSMYIFIFYIMIIVKFEKYNGKVDALNTGSLWINLITNEEIVHHYSAYRTLKKNQFTMVIKCIYCTASHSRSKLFKTSNNRIYHNFCSVLKQSNLKILVPLCWKLQWSFLCPTVSESLCTFFSPSIRKLITFSPKHVWETDFQAFSNEKNEAIPLQKWNNCLKNRIVKKLLSTK